MRSVEAGMEHCPPTPAGFVAQLYVLGESTIFVWIGVNCAFPLPAGFVAQSRPLAIYGASLIANFAW